MPLEVVIVLVTECSGIVCLMILALNPTDSVLIVLSDYGSAIFLLGTRTATLAILTQFKMSNV